MSGAEAILVLGVISSIIAIVDGTKQAYDAASDAAGLPAAFREVATRLPIVQNILHSADQHIKDGDVDNETCKGIKSVVEACRSKATRLDKLFQAALPTGGASRAERYWKAVRVLGKGNKVEDLMKGILEDVHLLASNHGMNTVTKVEVEQIVKAITEVSAIPPSVTEEDTTLTNINNGPGPQNNYNAQGDQYNNLGSGKQYNAHTMRFGDDAQLEKSQFYSQTLNIYTSSASKIPNGSETSGQGQSERATIAFSSITFDRLTTDCLRALFVNDPNVYRKEIETRKDKLIPQSCDWILEIFDEFYSTSPKSILWIHGSPGKGKTMIAMALIDRLSEHVRLRGSDGILCHFFCDNTSDTQNTLTNALMTILRQYLEVVIPMVDKSTSDFLSGPVSTFLKAFASKGGAMFSSVEALWIELHRVLQFSPFRRLFFVLDALDECDEQSLESFLALVTNEDFRQPFGTTTHQTCEVKWILLSRNEVAIKNHLNYFPAVLKVNLDVYSSKVSAGVQDFINVKVQELATLKRYDEDLKEFVTSILRSKAQDTFLWVSLACRELRSPRVRSINTRLVLEKLPTGLSQMYDRIYQHIMSNEYPEMVEFARNILRSITLASRPLSLGELAVTAGLPVSIQTNATVIEEYLEECGSFLAMEKPIKSSQKSSSFLDSQSDFRSSIPAATNTSNIDAGYDSGGKLAIELDQTLFIDSDSSDSYDSDSSYYESLKDLADLDDTPLALPRQARKDLEKRVHFIHQSAKDYLLKLMDGQLFSPSCTLEHESIALRSLEYLDKFKLKNDKDLSHAIAVGWRYPINNWYFHGDLALERMLSAPVAHFDIFRPSSSLLRFWLQCRGLRNHCSSRSKEQYIPLQHFAAFEGITWILEQLVQKQGNQIIDQSSEIDGTTPLMWAIEGGSQKTARWLLERGADPNPSREIKRVTPSNPDCLVTIHTAIDYTAREYPDILDLLLEFKANINHKSRGGQTPLALAVVSVEQDTEYPALSSEVNLRVLEKSTQIPLPAITRLLERGANPNLANDSTDSPLHLAAQGDLGIASLLLNYGANPRQCDSAGQTPLHWAAYMTNNEMIDCLINSGADVNQMDNEAHTAIYYAARNGSIRIVQTLLNRGADRAQFEDGCKAYNAERWTKFVWDGLELIPRTDSQFAPSVLQQHAPFDSP